MTLTSSGAVNEFLRCIGSGWGNSRQKRPKLEVHAKWDDNEYRSLGVMTVIFTVDTNNHRIEAEDLHEFGFPQGFHGGFQTVKLRPKGPGFRLFIKGTLSGRTYRIRIFAPDPVKALKRYIREKNMVYTLV